MFDLASCVFGGHCKQGYSCSPHCSSEI
uniref:Uncharacterized protein n=1 Tax=Arundo donax TaxID=35708 RepID=A0A0A9B192_ARUDO